MFGHIPLSIEGEYRTHLLMGDIISTKFKENISRHQDMKVDLRYERIHYFGIDFILENIDI